MSRSLTAQDRSSLIKLASSLPAGSPERKAILAGLGQTKKASTGKIRPFTKNDWRRFNGVENFENGSEPFILELDFKGDFPATGEENSQRAVLVADPNGVGIHFTSNDGDEGPRYYLSMDMDEYDAELQLEKASRSLSQGVLPRGFQEI